MAKKAPPPFLKKGKKGPKGMPPGDDTKAASPFKKNGKKKK